MNREIYFDYIEERLATLSFRINSRGKLNLHDLNLHSENFYAELLNLLFSWNLENINETKRNAVAIDLIDKKQKIIVQVSATHTYQKIQSALNHLDKNDYSGYHFFFLSLSLSTNNLGKGHYKKPLFIVFDPINDIFDTTSIIIKVHFLRIGLLEKVYDLIKKELGEPIPPLKLYSDITRVAQALVSCDLEKAEITLKPMAFAISDKIAFNRLLNSKTIIDQYYIYQDVLENIYTSFNQSGKNMSFFVLAHIHNLYLTKYASFSGDALFYEIINDVRQEIVQSNNLNDLSEEEIEVSVSIIVVDAFLRCKIFEKPQ